MDAVRNVEKLDEGITRYCGLRPVEVVQEEIKLNFCIYSLKFFIHFEIRTIFLDPTYGVPIVECNCQAQLVLKSKKDGKGFYLGCRTYPTCKTTLWFPSSIKEAQATDEICQNVI